jgi:hypothetical protein
MTATLSRWQNIGRYSISNIREMQERFKRTNKKIIHTRCEVIYDDKENPYVLSMFRSMAKNLIYGLSIENLEKLFVFSTEKTNENDFLGTKKEVPNEITVLRAKIKTEILMKFDKNKP